ncbi:hypothetical protein CHS0354_009232 [Potamilus streckersoni]|uniref:Uncharacterized protein n=1 Tax=Potamilus streckersoni TaxID=2493646 RepID=A0AAE0S6I9_9BIVA|nr:hypothetical protein CHS0354_009232 [Potamilus streckersoni]
MNVYYSTTRQNSGSTTKRNSGSTTMIQHEGDRNIHHIKSESVVADLRNHRLKKPLINESIDSPADNNADYAEETREKLVFFHSQCKNHTLRSGEDTDLPDINWENNSCQAIDTIT